MKIAFRIECPHCKWGYEWRDSYVNQGWLEAECAHCGENFFFKISIPTVDVQTSPGLPECMQKEERPAVGSASKHL